MKNTLPATQVRQDFFNVIEQIEKAGQTLTITLEGKPKVVMMSVEDFEGWQETLEIMSDTELMKSLRKSMAEVKAGNVYTLEEVKKKWKL